MFVCVYKEKLWASLRGESVYIEKLWASLRGESVYKEKLWPSLRGESVDTTIIIITFNRFNLIRSWFVIKGIHA